MYSIFAKEINTFFSSLIAYIVIGVFLVILGLVIWVFPDTSLLNYGYATLDQLFEIAPLIFIFLVPAITMRSFAEENQNGTFELLSTKPITDFQILFGKYLACTLLLVIAIVPTAFYYYTVYQLASPVGDLDSGAILGSYFGLILLGQSFVSIGIFASSLSQNQIVAFVLSTFLCFFVYYGFDFLSRLPVFVGKSDDLVQMLGIDSHYKSISRGVIDTRDLIYFISLTAIFLLSTQLVLSKRKW